MGKNIWIWIVLVVLLLVSSSGTLNRWKAEAENKTYELAAPFEEINDKTIDDSMTIDEVLSSFRESGLTTVSLNPFNIYDLEAEGIVSIYNESELYDILRFTNSENVDLSKTGYYITKSESAYYNDLLVETFNPEELTISGESFYFIPEDSDIKLSTGLGYDERSIKQIEKHGLNYILRVINDTSDSAQAINNSTVDSLLDLKTEKNSNLLFSGQEVIGYPEIQNMNKIAEKLHQSGFRFYSIEFTRQLGLQSVARETDYSIVRLHSISLDNKTLEENIDQAVRAVKERNIRSVFVHLQTGDSQESLENAQSFIAGVHDRLPDSFHSGTPNPFKQINTPLWIEITLVIAGVMFSFLASSILKNRWLRISAVFFMCLLALSYFLLQKLLLLQAFALIIAVITPIFAVLSTGAIGTDRISKITIQYIKAVFISFLGIFIVIGLLNGNAFITGFEIFRGVKLVYILPILFVAGYLFIKPGTILLKNHGINLLKAEVKYWHLIIFIIIGAMGIYYISRTGNTGTVSEIELMIRNTLEEVLYVRPRTKEFLIGFPLYILSLYVLSKHYNLGKLLLIPGTIGFLSIMNTFTHFHIPLHISFLRTAYSIVIGYIIGLLLIYLYKICTPYIGKVYKRMWS
ncbi:DUF5693 family protein [Oceanobacillus massiliensis]|uniref:DUF5693 family protein n=1 Tax=Oceanobacillus massiliensis TaxID=1465765 RepID=UPI000288EE37|nr:DUF5693 family protein [Oceanobacillus massiliensis]